MLPARHHTMYKLASYAAVLLVICTCCKCCLAAKSTPTIAQFCPASRGVIDATFPRGEGCFAVGKQFHGPSDNQSWTFDYDPKSGVVARFYLKAMTGSVTMTITSPGRHVILSGDSSTHSPAVLALSKDVPGIAHEREKSPWLLHVTNNGIKSQWHLYVDVVDDSGLLNSHQRSLFSSLYNECCPSGSWHSSSSPCAHLSQWSNPQHARFDACRLGLNYCNNGVLQMLSLTGPHLRRNGDIGLQKPWLNARCTEQVPDTLSRFQTLKYLDLTGLGVKWSISDVLQAVKPMANLTDLFIGSNRVSGQLAGREVCDYFKGSRLRALWLGNDHQHISTPSNPPSHDHSTSQDASDVEGNAVTGSIAACVFESRLELLNLDHNQITKLPSIPAGSHVRYLHLRRQHSVGTRGGRTLSGEQLPSSFSSLGLEHLDLADNGLEGSMGVLSLNKNLQWLDVSHNNLEGEVTHVLRLLPNLTFLNLAGNKLLSCNIPGVSSELHSLEYMNMNGVGAYGDLLSSRWNTPALRTLELSDTQVTGGVPTALATLPLLSRLDLSNNPGLHSVFAFSTQLDRQHSKITYFDVSNCSLEQLPQGLSNLGFFHQDCVNDPEERSGNEPCSRLFDVSGNFIQQPLPDWLLGPYSSNCFSRHHPQATSCVNVQWPKLADENAERQARPDGNNLTCPLTVPSSKASSFAQNYLAPNQDGPGLEHGWQGTFCYDAAGQEVAISAHVSRLCKASQDSGLTPAGLAAIVIGAILSSLSVSALSMFAWRHCGAGTWQLPGKSAFLRRDGDISLALLDAVAGEESDIHLFGDE